MKKNNFSFLLLYNKRQYILFDAKVEICNVNQNLHSDVKF